MREFVNGTNLYVTSKSPSGKIMTGFVERGSIPEGLDYEEGCTVEVLSTSREYKFIDNEWAEQTLRKGETGSMMYYDGVDWVSIPAGDEGDVLTLVDISEDDDPLISPRWVAK